MHLKQSSASLEEKHRMWQIKIPLRLWGLSGGLVDFRNIWTIILRSDWMQVIFMEFYYSFYSCYYVLNWKILPGPGNLELTTSVNFKVITPKKELTNLCQEDKYCKCKKGKQTNDVLSIKLFYPWVSFTINLKRKLETQPGSGGGAFRENTNIQKMT